MSEKQYVDQMTDAEINALCDNWDQTEPSLQRKIFVQLGFEVAAAEADVQRLEAELKEARELLKDYPGETLTDKVRGCIELSNDVVGDARMLYDMELHDDKVSVVRNLQGVSAELAELKAKVGEFVRWIRKEKWSCPKCRTKPLVIDSITSDRLGDLLSPSDLAHHAERERLIRGVVEAYDAGERDEILWFADRALADFEGKKDGAK